MKSDDVKGWLREFKRLPAHFWWLELVLAAVAIYGLVQGLKRR